MKKIFLLACLLTLTLGAFSQRIDPVYTHVGEMPEFPGGENKLYEFLGANIEYPKEAMENGITGEVYAAFVVTKEGTITNAKIVRDIGGGCGDAVLAVIKKMPKWKPGRLNGEAVRVEYTLPVTFSTLKEKPSKK